MESKKWYSSKTIWVATMQSVIGLLSGVILVLQQGLSGEAVAALGLGIKGLVDLYLRLNTSQPIL